MAKKGEFSACFSQWDSGISLRKSIHKSNTTDILCSKGEIDQRPAHLHGHDRLLLYLQATQNKSHDGNAEIRSNRYEIEL